MGEKKFGSGVGVILLRKDGHILIGRRNDDPAKASCSFKGEGKWCIPGGKLHFGESFEEAAIREVKEETGMTAKDAKVICVLNCRDENSHYVTIGLLCKDFKGEPEAMEEDVVEWKWVDPRKLPDMYFPSENVIKNFLEGVFYKY